MNNTILKFAFLSLFFVGCLLPSFSQTPFIDSLRNELKENLADSNRLDILIELSHDFSMRNPQEGLEFGEQAIALAQKLDLPRKEITALIGAGYNHIHSGNLVEAKVLVLKARMLDKEQGHLDIGDVSNILGFLAFYDNKLDSAMHHFQLMTTDQDTLKQIMGYGNMASAAYDLNISIDTIFHYYQTALSLAKTINNKTITTRMLNNLGIIERNRGNYQDALEYTLQAYTINDSLQLYDPMLANLHTISLIHKDRGEVEEEQKYLEQIIQIARNNNISSLELAKAYADLSVLLAGNQNYQKALEAGNKATNIGQDIQNLEAECLGYAALATTYEKMGNIDVALEQAKQAEKLAKIIQYDDVSAEVFGILCHIWLTKKQPQKTIFYAKQIEDFPEDNIRYQVKELSKKHLYLAYEQLNDWKNAFYYLKEYKTISDSLNQQANTDALNRIETEFQTQQQIQENKRLAAVNAATIKQRNQLLIGAAILSLLLLGIVWLYLQMRKAKNQMQIARNQIKTQNEQLEHLTRTKDRFFANISHELRTPLTLILNPLKNLLKTGTFQKGETRQLQLMRQSSQQLYDRIEEMLALSKLEAGKLQLQERPLDINNLLRRIVANFESYAQQLGVALHLEIDGQEAAPVYLDEKKFEKIVNNLISNALKFTPKDGQVKVKMLLQDVPSNGSTPTHSQNLVLKVIDTGRGISKEDLPHVFDRYFQTKKKNAPAEGGTGIGLAIAKEFAHLMSGDLTAHSQVRKGSTFTLRLPLKEAVISTETAAVQVLPVALNIPKAVQPKSPTLRQHKDLATIMIVEDNPALREYLENLLSLNYNIISAENGKVAWDMLKKGEELPSLILSDVMMPEMDGFGLLRKVKANAATRLLPFIFLTAKSGMEDRLEALRIGVDDYLSKPFEEEELLARIHSMLTNYEERMAAFQSLPKEEQAALLAEAQPENSWLQSVEILALKELNNPQFSVQYLAEQVELSSRQFSRKIKLETGLTPNRYLREIRLQKAREMLEMGTTTTVKEVSEAVGFFKPRYFSDLFRERFGKLPSEYLT